MFRTCRAASLYNSAMSTRLCCNGVEQLDPVWWRLRRCVSNELADAHGDGGSCTRWCGGICLNTCMHLRIAHVCACTSVASCWSQWRALTATAQTALSATGLSGRCVTSSAVCTVSPTALAQFCSRQLALLPLALQQASQGNALSMTARSRRQICQQRSRQRFQRAPTHHLRHPPSCPQQHHRQFPPL